MLKRTKNIILKLEDYRLRFMIILISVCLCCVISAVAEGAVVATNVVCGEENETVVSFSRDPEVIVSKTSFEIFEGDTLDLDEFDASSGNSQIVIERNGLYNDSFFGIASLARSSSVSQTLELASKRVESEKNVKPFKVTIKADGKEKKLTVKGGTVEEAVISAGIKLSEDDSVNVPLDSELKKGLVITVKRVSYRDTVKVSEIDYKTKKLYDETMYEGESYVKRAGVKGEQTEYYIEKIVDSKVKDELLLGTVVTKKPKTEIIVCGSKKRIIMRGSTNSSGYEYQAISLLPAKIDIELDENGKPKNYKQKFVGSATAYYGGYATATGEKPMPGRVAVDPRKIPYHSKLYIVSCDGCYVYGYSEASDTGGFVYNSNTLVDLYFNTYSECVQFGRRNVEVYVLE